MYEKAFVETFGIEVGQLPGLQYQGVSSWDSVGHMSLIASLEDAFGIELDTDDIIDFSSFEAGKSILKKYQVEV
jgi:acyl carrier protein